MLFNGCSVPTYVWANKQFSAKGQAPASQCLQTTRLGLPGKKGGGGGACADVAVSGTCGLSDRRVLSGGGVLLPNALWISTGRVGTSVAWGTVTLGLGGCWTAVFTGLC